VGVRIYYYSLLARLLLSYLLRSARSLEDKVKGRPCSRGGDWGIVDMHTELNDNE
jgi:hypothetical protein